MTLQGTASTVREAEKLRTKLLAEADAFKSARTNPIVRVVLVDLPGIQQPHPRGQLGRHVEHPFPGGDQLLREQMPEPARALHRPAPLRPASGPAQQHPDLSRRSARIRSVPGGSILGWVPDDRERALGLVQQPCRDRAKMRQRRCLAAA
jgi:hypothetical protein